MHIADEEAEQMLCWNTQNIPDTDTKDAFQENNFKTLMPEVYKDGWSQQSLS